MEYNTEEYREKHRLEREVWRKNNPVKWAERRKTDAIKARRNAPKATERAFQRKLIVLVHYGNGKCACVRCGEARPACLSLDHINGRLNTPNIRKELKGRDLYLWLINNNFPDGLQTLCMNCQWVKRFENKEFGVKRYIY